MGMIWFSPHGYVTGDPSLAITFPAAGKPVAVVKCTAVSATPRSIFAALPLPPGAAVEKLVVCYQVSNDRSFIARTLLLETTTPDAASVKFDDPTTRQSTVAVCYTANVSRYTPAGTVTLELRLELKDVADTLSLGGIGVGLADDCAVARNDHLLGEFGPYSTIADAYATLKKAVDAILAQGGGVLCIPRDAPAQFYPRNSNEHGLDKAAVTIVDHRQGVEHTYVPPIGITSSQGSPVAGRILERDLAMNLTWQNFFPVVEIASRAPGGASSYSTRLTRDATKGRDARVYVPSLRGAFVGQVLLIDPGAAEETHPVKEMGIDTDGSYLVFDELTRNHAKETQIYNKNNVGGLSITDTSNCDNQSTSLSVLRTTYGTGDTFGIAAILRYQGNIESGLGDEGGVGVAANLEHDIGFFSGEVQTWDKDKRLLVYKAGARNPQTLGTSRPILNLHLMKRVTAGKVVVVPPGGSPLREPGTPSANESVRFIVGNRAASDAWNDSLVGRFIAIDEPTEYYGDRKPADPNVHLVYRWWPIIRIEPRADGRKNLYVERAIAAKDFFDGPTLFLADNYAPKELSYIIAPGAWASDVRDGVAGTIKGNIGAAAAADLRTIRLAPSRDAGTAFDFAAGDPITNPPGPDVWTPAGFRARNVPHFPGRRKGASFLSENLGTVQMGWGLSILGSGNPFDLPAVKARMKDGSAEYENGILIGATTDRAIVVQGAVETSAIDLWQNEGNRKKIRWFDKDAGLAGELHVDPDSWNFIFSGGKLDRGGDLDLTGHGTIRHNGLSATGTRARTLGARNVAVPAGSSSITIKLPKEEADDQYSVFVECTWMTMKVVANKLRDRFDVEFFACAPAGGTLDWFLVRLNG